MIVTVLNTSFEKAPPKIILYRDYRKFSHVNFRRDWESYFTLNDVCNMSNDKFVYEFMNILNNHARIKRKYVRSNQGPFINRSIRKEIMKRSCLRNKFLKDKATLSKQLYNKQRNLCTFLIRKAKKDYFSKLDPLCVSNNKKFWKTIKPLFSEKIIMDDNITLVENNK